MTILVYQAAPGLFSEELLYSWGLGYPPEQGPDPVVSC